MENEDLISVVTVVTYAVIRKRNGYQMTLDSFSSKFSALAKIKEWRNSRYIKDDDEIKIMEMASKISRSDALHQKNVYGL